MAEAREKRTIVGEGANIFNAHREPKGEAFLATIPGIHRGSVADLDGLERGKNEVLRDLSVFQQRVVYAEGEMLDAPKRRRTLLREQGQELSDGSGPVQQIFLVSCEVTGELSRMSSEVGFHGPLLVFGNLPFRMQTEWEEQEAHGQIVKNTSAKAMGIQCTPEHMERMGQMLARNASLRSAQHQEQHQACSGARLHSTNATPSTHRLPLGRDIASITSSRRLRDPACLPLVSFLTNGRAGTCSAVALRDGTSTGVREDLGQIINEMANHLAGLSPQALQSWDA
ncbi:hypothetical protein BKA70DRAFT_1227178 [Coprinopsis sp. MPI-PUGE-AT-0042]|nr:hypothetical protein BKA70DRAFT_1227178 [Coprinopsis sp. MPI-PUGE-AT-0042]